MRFAKQLSRRLKGLEDADEIAKVKADLYIAEVDLDYAIYYPFLEPYVSLYKSPTAEKKDDEPTVAQYLHTPRPPMWSVVEKVRQEGKAALEKLQNRKAETEAEETQSPTLKSPSPKERLPDKKREKQRRETKSETEKGLSLQKVKKSWEKARPAPSARNAGSDGDSDDGGFFE